MVAGGPHGVQHVELHSLADADFPATARTAIPAFIVLAEAVELAFSAFIDESVVCDGSPEYAIIAYWGPRG